MKTTWWHFPIWFLRRGFFASIPIFLSNLPNIQLVILLILNSFYIIWSWNNVTHWEKWVTKMEWLNEVLILLVYYHLLIMLTVTDIETFYGLGTSLIFFISFIIPIDLSLIFMSNMNRYHRMQRIKLN